MNFNKCLQIYNSEAEEKREIGMLDYSPYLESKNEEKHGVSRCN